jgi:hypothetical protein
MDEMQKYLFDTCGYVRPPPITVRRRYVREEWYGLFVWAGNRATSSPHSIVWENGMRVGVTIGRNSFIHSCAPCRR